MGKKCALTTLGCKVNQCDTQALQALMQQAGYEIVDFEEVADVYIINTCSVTAIGEKKSRQMIHRAKRTNPNAIIAVTGCYAQRAAAEVLAIEGVSLVIGTSNRSNIALLIEKAQVEKGNFVIEIANEKDFEELPDLDNSSKTRAFIKIQDGCDNFCSYCIIPYVRGRVRSRDMASILKQAKELAANGYKEIVLNGIHLSSYGKTRSDLTLGNEQSIYSLADVIEQISEIKGIRRIRLGSLEPRIISEEFVQRLEMQKKLCPNFHLSLQSGSDSVLGRMNRKYTTAEYENAVALLRKSFPNAAISTDIIVGFPNETQEEFLQTLIFVEKIGFAWVHVFAYSKREGTRAAQMEGQLSNKAKQERAGQLSELCKKQGEIYRSGFIGKSVEVLCENFETGTQNGLTREHLQVEFKCKENLSNTFVNIKITGVTESGLLGELEEKAYE